MRSGFNLRDSVAHRRACLYLYRTLLKQCRLLPDQHNPPISTTSPPTNPVSCPNTPTTSSTLFDLIRTRFRYNRTLLSNHAITSSLASGRSLLTLLISATTTGSSSSSSSATTHLAALAASHVQSTNTTTALKTHHVSQRKPPRPSKLKKIAHLEETRSKFWAKRIPNPIPILQRPVAQSELPDPTRPRKVPHLIAAQGIPFLRYKAGPQSPELSRIIRQYNARDQRRWDLLGRLVHEIDLAVLEDRWDGIVRGLSGVQKEGEWEDGNEEGEAEEEERCGESGTGIGNRVGGWYNKSASNSIGNANGNGGDTVVLGRELLRTRAGSWAAELKAQVKETQKKIAAVSVKRTAMSQRMWEIVVKEKELAEQEKVQRRERSRIRKESGEQAEVRLASIKADGE